jgi:transposase
MDTSSQSAGRQRRSIAQKREIVEATFAPGASVARVARAHGVNANQVFGWRRLYLAGRLGQPVMRPRALLPVTVSDSAAGTAIIQVEEKAAASNHHGAASSSVASSTIHIKLRKAHLRIEGSPDPALLRAVLESLRR